MVVASQGSAPSSSDGPATINRKVKTPFGLTLVDSYEDGHILDPHAVK